MIRDTSKNFAQDRFLYEFIVIVSESITKVSYYRVIRMSIIFDCTKLNFNCRPYSSCSS